MALKSTLFSQFPANSRIQGLKQKENQHFRRSQSMGAGAGHSTLQCRRWSQKVPLPAKSMQDLTLGFQTPETQLQQLIAHMQQQQHSLIIEPRTKKIARHKFTPEEDKVLRNLVAQFGKSDWAAIAQRLENRTPRQCRERWKHYLSPEVSTSN
jgi:hypothetical protein